jgi:hypothetical protein
MSLANLTMRLVCYVSRCGLGYSCLRMMRHNFLPYSISSGRQLHIRISLHSTPTAYTWHEYMQACLLLYRFCRSTYGKASHIGLNGQHNHLVSCSLQLPELLGCRTKSYLLQTNGSASMVRPGSRQQWSGRRRGRRILGCGSRQVGTKMASRSWSIAYCMQSDLCTSTVLAYRANSQLFPCVDSLVATHHTKSGGVSLRG